MTRPTDGQKSWTTVQTCSAGAVTWSQRFWPSFITLTFTVSGTMYCAATFCGFWFCAAAAWRAASALALTTLGREGTSKRSSVLIGVMSGGTSRFARVFEASY